MTHGVLNSEAGTQEGRQRDMGQERRSNAGRKAVRKGLIQGHLLVGDRGYSMRTDP